MPRNKSKTTMDIPVYMEEETEADYSVLDDLSPVNFLWVACAPPNTTISTHVGKYNTSSETSDMNNILEDIQQMSVNDNLYEAAGEEYSNDPSNCWKGFVQIPFCMDVARKLCLNFPELHMDISVELKENVQPGDNVDMLNLVAGSAVLRFNGPMGLVSKALMHVTNHVDASEILDCHKSTSMDEENMAENNYNPPVDETQCFYTD